MTTKIAYSNIAASTLAVLGGPKIATIAYPGTETATDTQGGETITLTGTGFNAGASVIVNGQTAGVVTVISSTQVTFTAPAQSAGTYAVYLVNTDGGTAIAVPGLSYSGTPAWTTSAGSLGNLYETGTIAQSLVATGDAPIVYSVVSGTLPPGSTLSSSGQLSGTSQAVASATTYNFTVQAKDAQNQPTNRAFSVTINPDVVVWSSPAADSVNVLAQGVATTVTLAATAASGQSVSYAANTLPTGMSISGNTVTGTPTTTGTTSSTITATSAVTSKSATRTFSWSVTVSGDTYFAYNALLLNGETTAKPFNSDASLNASEIAVFGDTRPNNFNPYQSGYYSNYFNGSTNYLSIPASTALVLNGDFTIECWVYTSTLSGNQGIIASSGQRFGLIRLTNYFYWLGSTDLSGSSITINANTWYHVAVSRSGSTFKMFVNGVMANSGTYSEASTSNIWYIGSDQSNEVWNGYISNVRVVKGTALYTTNFTPSTAPLTAISGTSLLTCQSSQFKDNSTNAFTITAAGTPTVSYSQPFAQPTTVNVPSYYSTKFNGSTDYLLAPLSTSLALGTGDFTIEAWVYLNSVSGTQGVYTSIDNTNDSWAGVTLGFSGTSFIATSYISSADTITHQTTVSTGQWYHLAVVRSGSSTKSYLNGVQSIGTTSGNYNLTQSGSTIGSYYPGSSPLNGHISNLRVVKGTAVYTANFTPPTQPLTAIANTSLLTCQNSTLIDNSTNAFAITSAGSAAPVSVTPFTQAYTQQTVSNYGATYFDGDGDYLTIPANAAFTLGTNNHTIECWYYANGTQLQNTTLWAYASGSTNQATNSYYLNVGTGGPAIVLGNGGGWGISITFTAPSINVWHHIAVVRSGNVFTLYIDGVSTGTGTYAANIASQSSYPFEIGGQVTGSGSLGTTAFNGYISNFRVTNGTAVYTSNFAPPAQPLAAIANTSLLTCQYNQGSNNSQFLDSGNYSQPIARNGNPTQGSFAPFGSNWSNYFNGSTDYLTVANNAAFDQNTAFTVECWAYTISAGYIFIELSSGYLGVVHNSSKNFVVDKSYVGTSITSSSTFSFNQWNHIALCYDGTTTRLFINGTLQGSVAGGGAASGAAFNIGSYAGSNYYNGYVSNFRVTKSALYTSVFTPSTTPLAPITNTTLLTCQSPTFQDVSANNYALTITGTPSVQRFSPFSNVVQTPQSYSSYFGSANYISAASNAAFALGTGDFTVEAWVYPTSAYTTYNYILGVAVTDGLVFYVTGSNLVVRAYNTGDLLSSATIPALNTWTHIAATRSGTTLKIFVNGVQTATATNSTNFAQGAPYIGNDGTNAAPWYGYISNFRLVKGTAVYTANFTPPTAPLTAISGTSLLTCQDATFKDNSTNAFTITTSGTPKPKTVNPFGYTTSSLQAYSPTVYGGSMYFDGSGDYLTTSSGAIPQGTENFTIEFWLYKTTAWSTGNMLFVSPSSSTNNALQFYINTGGPYIQLSAYGVTGILTYSYSTLTINTWYHFALTRVGNLFTLYVNGVSVATATNAQSFATPTGTAIGGDGISGYSFAGYLSNLRIVRGTAVYTSNFVPPLAPVTATTNTSLLFNGTNAGIYDYSMMNDLETVGNTQLAPQQPYAGSYYSNYFNGSSYFTVPSNTVFNLGSNNFTIECWFNTATVSGDRVLIDRWNFGSTQYMVRQSGTSIQAYFYTNTTQSITSSTLSINTWYHVAFVRSGSVFTLYLNGVSVGTPITDSSALNIGASTLGIGGYASANYHIGYISNARIVNGTAVYTSNFTPSTTPLTAISGTSLLTCQSNQFKDNSTNAFTLTASGTPKVQIFNPFANSSGQSIYFDGSGDYLNIPVTQSLQLGSNNFTIEFWLYVPTLPSARNNITYLNANTSGYAAISLQITSSNKLGLSISESGSSWKYDDATTGVGSALTAGTWQHVAVVRNGQNVQIYLNGTAQGSAYALTSATTSLMTSYTLNQLGVYNSGYNYLNGYLDDFRITNGYARYTSNFTVPTTTLPVK